MKRKYRAYAYEDQARELMGVAATAIDECAGCARWLAGPGARAGTPRASKETVDRLQAYQNTAGNRVQALSYPALSAHLENLADMVHSAQASVDSRLIAEIQYSSDEFTARPFVAQTWRPLVVVKAWIEATSDLVLCFAILLRIDEARDFEDPFLRDPGLGCFRATRGI